MTKLIADLFATRYSTEADRRHGRGPLLGRLMLIRQRAGTVA